MPDERERPADDALDAKRQAARLLELIAGLPEAQREAFLLQQEGGMSVEEIAQATGCHARDGEEPFALRNDGSEDRAISDADRPGELNETDGSHPAHRWIEAQ